MKIPVQKEILSATTIIIVCVIALVVILSLNQVKQVDNTTKGLIQTENNLLEIQQITSLAIHFELIAETFYVKEKSEIEISQQKIKIAEKISALRKEEQDSPEEKMWIDSFINTITHSVAFSEKMIEAKKKNKFSAATDSFYLHESKLKIDSVKLIADKVGYIENLEKKSQSNDSIKEIKALKIIFYICIGAVFLTVLFIIRKIQIDLAYQKKVNRELIYMHELLNQTEDAIYTTTKETVITSWNKGAEKLYGYTANEAIGKKSLDILKIKKTLIDFETFDFSKNSFLKKESTHYNKDGEQIIVDVSLSYKTAENSNGYFLIILSDITEKKKAEEKIKHLASIIELSNDAIYTTDKDFRIKSWNKGAEKMYGYTEKELIGKTEYQILPAYHPVFSELDIAQYEKQGYFKTESTHRKRGGDVFIVAISVTYLKEEDGNTKGFIIIVNDITEIKKLEGKLKNFNEKLETEVIAKTKELNDVFGRVTDGFIALNNQNCFTYINKKAGEIFKRNWKELIGKNMEVELAEIGDTFFKAYEKTVKTQQYIYFEDFFANLKSWIEFHFYPSAEGVSVYFKDVTEQKKIQQDLIKLNYRFRNLASHIQNTREEERINIAREIHDELGQMATAIKIDLSWMKKKIKGENEEVIMKMDNSIAELGEMVNSIRRIAQELRPSILDNLGLTAAIEWYCGDFQKRTAIQCKFDNEIGDITLNDNVKTNLFRICQESLTNVMRHASATKVDCTIKKEEKKIILIIEDNGKGFDPSQKTKSLGLLGMQERALLINGELKIESSDENGTRIKVEVEL